MSVRYRRDRGGLLRTLTPFWDSDDWLQQVTSGANTPLSASYNGDGERVSKTDFWTGLHNYSWGPGGILSESNEQSGPTTYTPS